MANPYPYLTEKNISWEQYLSIAQLYAKAYCLQSSSVQYLYDAVEYIVEFDSIIPEVDMLNDFWNAYLLNIDPSAANVLYLGAVRSMNQHAISESGATDINNYFVIAGMPLAQILPPEWAALSLAAGYQISPVYVSSTPSC